MAKALSPQEKAAREALAQLEKLGGQLFQEENIVFEGKKIILPEGTTIDWNIKQLNRRKEEDEEVHVWRKAFPFRPMDGANATETALRRAFGSVSNEQTWGFFGPNPPQFVDVEIGVGETKQVPWGAMSVPGIPEVTFYLQSDYDEDRGAIFLLVAEGPKKMRAAVEGVFRLVAEELERNSIYRGKVIDGNYSFVDTRRVDPKKVVYAAETQAQLEANIFARLRYPDQLNEMGVDLKGAVLLYGTFGVGKTLAAYLTAQEAERHGWTFILVRPTRDSLEQAMQTAAMYEPAVVFFEDIDHIASAESERDRIIGMLDLFDGVRAKGKRVLAVLTTNRVDVIHAGMLRPGRIDAVIEVPAPDADGIVKLVKARLPEDKLESLTKAQWREVTDAMEGFLPAFVGEAVDRAVRYMLVRTGGEAENVKLNHKDLAFSALGLRPQLELMAGAGDEPKSDRLEQLFAGLAEDAVHAVVDERLAPAPYGPKVTVERQRDQV